MSSEALSEQLCVREGAGYDEVYLSGQDDPVTFYSERVPSVNSPSQEEEEEDSDVDGSESDTYGDLDGEENVESPIYLSLALTALGISFFPLCGRSMILT